MSLQPWESLPLPTERQECWHAELRDHPTSPSHGGDRLGSWPGAASTRCMTRCWTRSPGRASSMSLTSTLPTMASMSAPPGTVWVSPTRLSVLTLPPLPTPRTMSESWPQPVTVSPFSGARASMVAANNPTESNTTQTHPSACILRVEWRQRAFLTPASPWPVSSQPPPTCSPSSPSTTLASPSGQCRWRQWPRWATVLPWWTAWLTPAAPRVSPSLWPSASVCAPPSCSSSQLSWSVVWCTRGSRRGRPPADHSALTTASQCLCQSRTGSVGARAHLATMTPCPRRPWATSVSAVAASSRPRTMVLSAPAMVTLSTMLSTWWSVSSFYHTHITLGLISHCCDSVPLQNSFINLLLYIDYLHKRETFKSPILFWALEIFHFNSIQTFLNSKYLKVNYFQDEGYHPHAASTYLTEHIGGIYSVEQGREIGFTSSNLPLAKPTQFSEDTESQYADELRRQAYIQTLGRC